MDGVGLMLHCLCRKQRGLMHVCCLYSPCFTRFIGFYRFFDRLANDLGNKLMALNSLWSPHYFAKTGYYTAVGAEAAQGLPNAQLFYAFLRGAAKQFGKWIWGNVSVYNRFSFKSCSIVKQVCECSADGTSLSLMRRLMYQQIMYGSKIFGFETLGGCGVRNPLFVCVSVCSFS